MSKGAVRIRKTAGEAVDYDPEKLKHSLQQAGADANSVYRILQDMDHYLYDGISTRKIYQRAFSLLRKYTQSSAARYKLKRAIMELGPSGYPFERYVGELFKAQGYAVQVGVFMEGNCIPHEVDVWASRAGEQLAAECKFGNTQGKKVDVKVALYMHARFLDLERKWRAEQPHADTSFSGWIITNGHFTTDAIRYGSCVGLRLMAWAYPRQHALKELIARTGMYPITSLTHLRKSEKQQLLDAQIVMCKQLQEQPTLLHDMRIPERRLGRVMQEVQDLCLFS